MKVLLVLDDSQEAQEYALDLVRNKGAVLTALFVLDATWDVFLGHDWLLGSDARADFLGWMKGQEEKAADKAFVSFSANAGDLPFTKKCVAGEVQAEVLKEAALGYDLVIMANPLLRGLERVRKGTAHMAEHCPCDLLLVKRKATTL